MSVNTTPFLHLPQWDANEQPSYLGEINPAFAAIDSGYGDIKTLAQTGVSGSQEAITTANAAKAQSQANAGAITTLQQALTQLEADFINASSLKNKTFTPTEVVDTITFSVATVVYNKYNAFFKIYLKCTKLATFLAAHSSDSIALGKLPDIPFIFQRIDLSGGFSFPLNMTDSFGTWADKLSAWIKADGTVVLGAASNTSGSTATTLNLVASLPIFMSSSARNAVNLDNCLYAI